MFRNAYDSVFVKLTVTICLLVYLAYSELESQIRNLLNELSLF